MTTSDWVRAGKLAANSNAMNEVWVQLTTAVFFEPTASKTENMSSIQVSSVGGPPRLSEAPIRVDRN
jgi:hypothetical protein